MVHRMTLQMSSIVSRLDLDWVDRATQADRTLILGEQVASAMAIPNLAPSDPPVPSTTNNVELHKLVGSETDNLNVTASMAAVPTNTAAVALSGETIPDAANPASLSPAPATKNPWIHPKVQRVLATPLNLQDTQAMHEILAMSESSATLPLPSPPNTRSRSRSTPDDNPSLQAATLPVPPLPNTRSQSQSRSHGDPPKQEPKRKGTDAKEGGQKHQKK